MITAIPLMLFASAAQSIPFTLLGPLNLLVPVINFGLGWLLYDEPMPADAADRVRLRVGRAGGRDGRPRPVGPRVAAK